MKQIQKNHPEIVTSFRDTTYCCLLHRPYKIVLLSCTLLLAVERSPGKVIRVAPLLLYLFIFIYCTGNSWRDPINRPEDLTTANRSTHNSKQNKLVRSV